MEPNKNLEKSNEIRDLKSLDEYLSNIDNSVDNVYVSQVPNVCKEYPCCLGIDEAGRGPVLGPMVYGISFCPINELDFLSSLNCADSKTLTEENREVIFENIAKNTRKIGWAVEVISPNVISNSMLGRVKRSLNQVSMDSAIGLVKAALKTGAKIEHVYVDTVGRPEKYQAYLKTIFPNIKITVEKKADSKFAIVSAASICAKVVRDHALKTWNFGEGLNLTHEQFGSGYPGDPVTKKFLQENIDLVFGFPQIVRFGWSTAAKILEDEAYHVEFEEIEEEETQKSKGNPAITSFFASKRVKTSNCEFFKQACLNRTVEL